MWVRMIAKFRWIVSSSLPMHESMPSTRAPSAMTEVAGAKVGPEWTVLAAEEKEDW